MVNVVLVEPQIPQNTGSVGRLCAGHQIPLHLIRPLGFSLDDRYLKRAGLDYWPHIDLHLHDSLPELLAQAPGQPWFFSARAERDYWDVEFDPEDLLIFGREADGLPKELLAASPERVLRVPHNDKIRSLNLATTVGIVVYEALRQRRS